MMISRSTPANSSTLRSPPQPSRHSNPPSRPTTPSRRSMATQSPRRSRTKASKPPAESATDDALFALLGIPTPEPAPAVTEVPAPKKAQKGLLTLTDPQMAAIRGDAQPSTPQRRAKGRKAAQAPAHSGTDSDVQGAKQPRNRGGKGKGKALNDGDPDEHTRPKHNRTKSEPSTKVQETHKPTHPATSIPWDGLPRLDRELEPFDVASVPLPDARIQALLEPLEDGQSLSRSSSRRIKQPKSKRNREKDLERTDDSDAFETTSLSRSLPASSFVGKGKQVETEADVWDMPIEAGKGAGEQGLTWQQALQQSRPDGHDVQTPNKHKNRKANPSTGVRQQPTRAVKGVRRYSFDQNVAVPGAGHGFVYPGMNANRAPQVQTPTKAVPASVLTGSLEPSHGIAAGHGQAPAPGLFKQYAGPTFHNSPLAGSLPRPNNDDF